MSSERHWLHVFSTFEPGGSQLRMLQIAARLPRTHRHSVVAMDGRTSCAERAAADVRLDLVAPPPAGRRGTWAVGSWAQALLRRLRPDLLLTYNFGAIESLLGAARARHRAVVHHEDGFGPEESERLLRRRNWLRRALLRAAAAVVVPSRTLERIALRAWRQPAWRVHYLPNGVDLRRFAPVPRPPRAPVVVGNVAAFRPVKDQALLVRALGRMRARGAAHLRLFGDGPERAACAALAAATGMRAQVEFAGPAVDAAAAYRELDVFALPSRTEQMPLVLLEAMASGLPIAATDVGDVKEMVAPANARLVVPRGDAAALAGALDALVEDAALRAELGRANRARCEQSFDAEVCLARWVELFARCEGAAAVTDQGGATA